MKKIELSEKEKKLLTELNFCNYEIGKYDDKKWDSADLYVAAKRLQSYGLIKAHFVEECGLAFATILEEGIVYLRENPRLENPFNDDELKRLQIEELEYRKKIRKQEDIIRFWKLLNAIIGIISVIGWLLFFRK